MMTNSRQSENKLYISNIGLINVSQADTLMTEAAHLRSQNKIRDLILILSHPETITLGLKGSRQEVPKDLLVSKTVLKSQGIALLKCIRGGGITYHWPGQIVCYPIIALPPENRNISTYMYNLEEVGILTLKHFNIHVKRRRDSASHVGLWLGSEKILSMGIRVSNWVTSFGFALNVQGDIGPASYIRPCGIEGAKLTTMQKILGYVPDAELIIRELCNKFGEVFERQIDSWNCPVINFQKHQMHNKAEVT
jgi:lipoate-protein ligase B